MTQRIGHYTVQRKLGEGAMGAVYEGLDESLQMKVAIKVLSPNCLADQENLSRFEREAQAAANLRHPNIAHVFFIGRTPKNIPYYAMEYIDGVSLADVVKQRMLLSGEQVLNIMIQTAKALQFSSEKGVLHRDVKPGNIMIEDRGRVKLVDFGLAKLQEGDSTLTQTGIALGTPNYLSPEQARGQTIDYRSDLYSLGITYFELLVGHPPYQSDTTVGVLMKHVQEPVPSISSINPDYPASLCRLIESMMAKSPDDRISDYGKIIQELNTIANSESRFTGGKWVFCQNCGCNVSLSEEGQCSSCKTELGEQEQEEVLYSVHVTGFQGPEANLRVAQYMERTTKKPVALIKQMLQRLPLLLATKLAYEKAKILQSKFYQMGAEVELRKSGVRKVKIGQSRKTLTMIGLSGELDKPGSESTRLSSEPANKPERSLNVKWVRVGIGLGVLLIAVLVFIVSNNYYSEPESQKTAVKAHAVLKAEAKETDKVEPSKEPVPIENLNVLDHISSHSHFRIRSFGIQDKNLLVQTGTFGETAFSQIGELLGSYPVETFKVVLDGRYPFSDHLASFALSAQGESDTIRIPAKGLKADHPMLKPVISALLAHNILRRIGGGLIPDWLAEGFGLHVVEKLYPNQYSASAQLAGSSPILDGPLWKQALSQQSSTARAQAAAVVGYLCDNYESTSLLALAKRFANGESDNQAISAMYQMDLNLLLQSWSNSRR